MTDAKKLTQLSDMQKLREQKCQGGVTDAAAKVETASSTEKRLLAERNAADGALAAVMQSATFCPDRMILAAGHLAIADDALVEGEAELKSAHSNEGQARDAWREARFRSDHIAGRARAARRKEDRKRDDASLAERLALRAALDKGPNS